MIDPDLAESAWHRAKGSTTGVYQSWTFALWEGFVGALGAGVGVIASGGHHDTATRVAVAVVCALAPVALVCIAIFAFQVATAPLRQRNELRLALSSFGRPQPVDIKFALMELRRRGQSFLKGMGTASFVLDTVGVEVWTAEAIHFLFEQGETDVAGKFIAASEEGQFVSSLKKQIKVLNEIVSSMA